MSITTSTVPHFISAPFIFRSAFYTSQIGPISSPCLTLDTNENQNSSGCWKCVIIDGELTILFTYHKLNYKINFWLVGSLNNCLPTLCVQDVARSLFLLHYQKTIRKTTGCLALYAPPYKQHSISITHNECETHSLKSESGSKFIFLVPSDMISLHSFSVAFRLCGTNNSHSIRLFAVFVLLFILLSSPSAYGVGLGLSAANIQHRDMTRQSAWRSSPFHDPARDNPNTGLQPLNDENEDYDPEPLPAYHKQTADYLPSRQPLGYPADQPPQLPPLGYPQQWPNQQQYLHPYAPNVKPAWAPQPGLVGSNVPGPYGQLRSTYLPEQVDNNRYYAIPQYYNFYQPNWGYPELQLAPGFEVAGGGLTRRESDYQWRTQNQGRKSKRRRKDDRNCPKICETCTRNFKNRKGSRFLQEEAEIEKGKADLQKRFADQIRPSNKHTEPVKALFGYMDTNGDGVIKFNELENYLLLHSIIMPELPESDRS